MHLTHLIADDFLSDPDEIRRMAAKTEFVTADGQTYFPGRNAASAIAIGGMDEAVMRRTGERLAPVPGTSHGKLRLALEGEEGSGGVHVDPSHWSGVLFLTRDAHCRGGTSFYRHLRTGTENAPVFPGEAEAMGYGHPSEVFADIVLKEGRDESKWEKLFEIPMKYNRLILFRGYLWHNAGPSFGASLEDGRLIMPLAYQPAQ